MANSFGIGFVVGATLAPTVTSVFSTVEHKIQSTSRRMEALSAKASMLGEAQGYSPMREHANVLKQIGREQFRLETLDKSREASQQRRQLRSGMMDAVVPMLAVGAPIKWAIDFESVTAATITRPIRAKSARARPMCASLAATWHEKAIASTAAPRRMRLPKARSACAWGIAVTMNTPENSSSIC